jgi:hypothetical protein
MAVGIERLEVNFVLANRIVTPDQTEAGAVPRRVGWTPNSSTEAWAFRRDALDAARLTRSVATPSARWAQMPLSSVEGHHEVERAAAASLREPQRGDVASAFEVANHPVATARSKMGRDLRLRYTNEMELGFVPRQPLGPDLTGEDECWIRAARRLERQHERNHGLCIALGAQGRNDAASRRQWARYALTRHACCCDHDYGCNHVNTGSQHDQLDAAPATFSEVSRDFYVSLAARVPRGPAVLSDLALLFESAHRAGLA